MKGVSQAMGGRCASHSGEQHEEGAVAGESVASVCEGQCGWSGGRESVCHVTPEQVAERSRSQRMWDLGNHINKFWLYPKNQGKLLKSPLAGVCDRSRSVFR